MFKKTFNKSKYALLLLFTTFNTFAIVTVGDMFNGCDFTTLTGAINDAQLNDGDSEIHVTNEFTQGFPGTISQSLTIKGGYDSCADALDGIQGTTKSNWTTASANTSVIRVVDNTVFNEEFLLTIDNFNILNGVSATQAGGINISSNSAGDSNIGITNSEIYANDGAIGGGIFTDGEHIILTISNTKIYNNSSVTKGGGINCINGSDIKVTEHSAINENIATNGGGVALEDCSFTLESGDIFAAGNMKEGIFENTVATRAGGIFALNSDISLLGNDTAPASVSNNTSNGDQNSVGGIYAKQSQIVARNARIDLNTAKNWTGGIYIEFNSTFDMDRLASPCWGDNTRCSSLSGNIANGVDEISTVAVGNFSRNTEVSIKHTVIEKNKASFFTLFSAGINVVINMEGNLIINNSDENNENSHSLIYLTDANGENNFHFTYNTVADNLTDRVFIVKAHTAIPVHLNIGNSIIWQPDSFIVERDDAISIISMDCLMLNYNNTEDFSLYNVGIVSQLDPKFVSPGAGNYHLDDNSPAQDFCDNSFLPTITDLNGIARGIDRTTIQNFQGVYDLGAFEHAQLNDLIYKQGFE